MKSRVRKGLADRHGAALPLAILVVAILMAGALAGLMRVTAEWRITANFEGEVDGLVLAEGGLQRYLANVTAPPLTAFDTVIVDLPGGIDSIAVRLVRPATGGLPALYVVRSTGISTVTDRFDTRTPPARRTIAEFAEWQSGSMTTMAAWTSITGLEKSGGSGTISGVDQCGMAPTIPGVVVPVTAVTGNPGYDQNGGSLVPNGAPPISTPAPNAVALAPLVRIDWSGIVNGGAIRPDYNLTGTSGWPPTFAGWPVILVRSANLSLGPGDDGQGLLLVTGNLSIHGSFSWDGVILVGGTLTSKGNNSVEGAVVTGLNVKLGQSVGASDVGNGTKTIRYNSCKVSQALSHLGSLVAIPNAWVDNWPRY